MILKPCNDKNSSLLLSIKSLATLIVGDLVEGFYQNRNRFFLACACIIAMVMAFIYDFSRSIDYLTFFEPVEIAERFGPLDLLLYFFAGCDFFTVGEKTPLELPIVWLTQQVLIALLVANYVFESLATTASQQFIRLSTRTAWWFSKVLWVVLTVLGFYGLETLIATTAAIVLGQMGPIDGSISSMVIGFPTSSVDKWQLVWCLLLPVFMSLAISLAQVVLSLAVGPFVAFLVVLIYTVLSVYFAAPPFVADASMALRGSSVVSCSTSSEWVAVICVAAFLSALILGLMIVNRRELL